MKKLIFILITMYMLCLAVYATPGYEPGITGDITPNKNEYKYSETIFLSGEPILMEGTVEIKESSNGAKTTYEYSLSNPLKAATLERKVVFLNSAGSDASTSQITYSTAIDPKYSETVEIGSDTYELEEYLFTRSGSSDERDIIRYIGSDWQGMKLYSKNDGIGQVRIDITAHSFGYNNWWSSTETAIIKHTITYRYKTSPNAVEYKEAYGTVDYAVSQSSMKNIQYVASGPLVVSYAGGYILKEGEENVVSYRYTLPRFSGGVPIKGTREGKDSYKLVTLPTQTRLVSYNINDISASYWAAEDIKRVTSLGIIDMAGADYFRPLSFMSRGEFAKAVIKVSDMKGSPTKQTRYSSFEQYYTDVNKNHPYYEYINRTAASGVMEGISKNRFGPDEYLTKAQAAVIIVRAIGMENSSTVSGTVTSFADDDSIQPWAKRSINIAHRMGIITGNENNEAEPNKMLTRAECAAMINRFIRYLQYDIRQEYRENMIDYGW